MKIKQFIENYKGAFSEAAELPLLFWYSDTAINTIEKINGCFFKCMNEVRAGISVSLNADVIGCGGGKFYTGFTDMPEYVPAFVSTKEKYKQTPDIYRILRSFGAPSFRSQYFELYDTHVAFPGNVLYND